jgi:hypothetical protein
MPVFSTASLVANFLFGSIGLVGFMYGKRMHLWKVMFCGLALMVYPYFFESALLLYGIGAAGTAALFFLRD